jgi:hypothetical protein
MPQQVLGAPMALNRQDDPPVPVNWKKTAVRMRRSILLQDIGRLAVLPVVNQKKRVVANLRKK